MRNMNIIFNTWPGAFFNPGGGEIQLLETKKALVAKGLNVENFDQWHPQKKCDIYHQFSIQPGPHYALNEYKNLGVKTALSTILWHDFPDRGDFYYNVKNMLNAADILLTNSDLESHLLAKVFEISIEKFHKTRNSITPDYFTLGDPNLFRNKYHIQKDFILCLANIDNRKNTVRLLEATKNLNIDVVLIGANREPHYFDAAKKLFTDRVHYIGPVYDTQILKSALKACKLFALPSLCETPGISALEAASQGARIVITNEGSTTEYFKDHAIYVNPLDVNSIHEGLQKGLDTKPSDQQISFILDNYTWDKTADDVITAYKKILS